MKLFRQQQKARPFPIHHRPFLFLLLLLFSYLPVKAFLFLLLVNNLWIECPFNFIIPSNSAVVVVVSFFSQNESWIPICLTSKLLWYSFRLLLLLSLSFHSTGSLGCWSHLDPVTARLRGLGHGLSSPTGQVSLKDVVYQDAGTYKCIGQSPQNKKKLEVLQTVGVTVKGKFPFLLEEISATK